MVEKTIGFFYILNYESYRRNETVYQRPFS